MVNNEFLRDRIVAGTFNFPANIAGNTASTLSAAVDGAYVPKGAIVEKIIYYTPAAVTNGSNLKNATLNPSAGGQVLGTADVVASVAIAQTALGSQAPAASGVYVSVGGPLVMNFASSDSARTGVSFNASVFVKYVI